MTKEEKMCEFGHRLDAIMSDMKINGARIQDITGISHTEITRARRGVLIPTREHARRIAIALEQDEHLFDDLYLPDRLEDEEWLPLRRHPEYLGSNKGRILNPNTGRIIKGIQDKRGRPKVQLSVGGKIYTARVQDLIDETFN